jgi:hypothetical protein
MTKREKVGKEIIKVVGKPDSMGGLDKYWEVMASVRKSDMKVMRNFADYGKHDANDVILFLKGLAVSKPEGERKVIESMIARLEAAITQLDRIWSWLVSPDYREEYLE